MKCPIETGEYSELLAYSEEKLEAARAAILKRHVEECTACREFVAGQRAVWSALDAWEPPAISADFDQRLYRLLNEPEPDGWWQRWLRPVLAHKSIPLETDLPLYALETPPKRLHFRPIWFFADLRPTRLISCVLRSFFRPPAPARTRELLYPRSRLPWLPELTQSRPPSRE